MTSARDPLTTRLTVRLTPRAGRDDVTGYRDEVLLVKVTAPPVDGAANEALVALLAKRLGLPRGSISIAHGQGSRLKLVDVEGLDRAQVEARLRAAGPGRP